VTETNPAGLFSLKLIFVFPIDQASPSHRFNQIDGDLLHTMDSNGLPHVRTELQNLLVIPSFAPHPVQPNGEPACHGHFRYATFSPCVPHFHRLLGKMQTAYFSAKFQATYHPTTAPSTAAFIGY
jgi:hypothetical protein